MKSLPSLLPCLLLAAALGATCPETEVRLDIGEPAGQSDSGEPYLFLAPDGALHVVWTDQRFANGDIWHSRSLDRGDSWTDPIQRLNVGVAPGDTGAFQPTVVADGLGRVAAGWVDDRDSLGFFQAEDLYVNTSPDNGASWGGQDVRVNTPNVNLPRAVADPHLLFTPDGSLHAIWLEERDGSPLFVRYSRSEDGGLSWLPSDAQVDDGDPDGLGGASALVAAASGGVLHVVFRASRLGEGGIWYSRSLDGGESWEADRRLSTAAGLSFFELGPPSLHVEGAGLVVSWHDGRAGEDDIFVVRSTDDGASWDPVEARLDGDAPGVASSRFPVLAGDGQGNLVDLWLDDRFGSRDVLADASSDGGGSWAGAPVRLDTGGAPGEFRSACLRAAGSPARIAGVWREDRGGMPGLYLNRTLDGGQSWLPADVRLDMGVPDDTTGCEGPRTRMEADGTLHVVWLDVRDGERDLYYARCGVVEVDPGDCAPGDPDTHTSPADVAEPVLLVRRDPAVPTRIRLDWTDLGPLVGPSVVYDVASGLLGELAADGGFARAACPCEDVASPRAGEGTCPGLAGGSRWFLVRGENSCGVGSFGRGSGAGDPDPREELDSAAGPCDP